MEGTQSTREKVRYKLQREELAGEERPAFSLRTLQPARLSIFTLGESLVTVTRKRNMDAAMPAIMKSNRP